MPQRREPYRKLMNYAFPAMAAGLLVVPAQWLANTLLAANASFAELGRYTVGMSLATYLFFIPDSIGLPFLPLVSRLNRERPADLAVFLLRTLRITTFLLLPPTMTIILFPEPILGLLFGTKGALSAPVARMLAAAIFFAGNAGIVGLAIAGIGRTWDGLAINMIWATVFLSLSFLLVPTMKEVGLAIAFLSAYVIHYCVTIAYASMRWSIRIKGVAQSSLISAGFLGASLLANEIVPGSSVFGILILAAVLIVEGRSMSQREKEVLSLPIRRLFGWLNRPP